MEMDQFYSSIVNEGIRALLNLFILFLQENFTRTKSAKSTKSIKITKMQISEQTTFFLLDVFYEHKKYKTQNK